MELLLGKKPFYRRGSFRVYKGLLLAIFASTFMALGSVIVKALYYMTAGDLAFVRFLGMFVLDMPLLVHSRSKNFFSKQNTPTLVMRGLLGSASFYLSFLSLKLMPIAESSVIVSTTPVWTTLLSRVILKEKIDLLNGVSLVLCMTGLVLMSKVFLLTSLSSDDRFTHSTYWYGCLAGLSSAILAALTFVCLRKLKDVHESVTIAYQSFIGVTGTAILVAISGNVNTPLCGADGIKILLLVLTGFLGQRLLTTALRLEKAGIISTIRFSVRVLVLFVFQIYLFKEMPDLYSILSAVLVCASLCVSIIRKIMYDKGL